MVISYKRLWRLLVVGRSSITKLGHNINANTDVLVKICNALHCKMWDIMELVPKQSDKNIE